METPFNQILNQLQPAVTTIIIEDLPTQDNLYQKLQEHNSFAAPWIAFASVFSMYYHIDLFTKETGPVDFLAAYKMTFKLFSFF